MVKQTIIILGKSKFLKFYLKLNKKIKKYKARVVIRKSGTENKIRIMAEAKDIKTTKNIFEESVRLLKEEKIW